MAFKTTVLNESIRNFILVLIVLPLVATSNIDCNGKAFHCVNSTHFMICVDLGGGVSSTIDNFIIPCPSSTVCQETNHFECEFPRSTTISPITITSVPSELTPSEISTTADTSYTSTTAKGIISEVESTEKTLNTVSITTLQEDSVTTNEPVTESVVIENTTTSDYTNVGYTFTTVPVEITTNTNIIIESTSTPNDIGSFVTETSTQTMSTINDVTVNTEKNILENIVTTEKSSLDYTEAITTNVPMLNQSATETFTVNDTYDSFTTEKYISTINVFTSTINESTVAENDLSIANNTFDNDLYQTTTKEVIDTIVGTTSTVANIDIGTDAAITDTFTEATEITTTSSNKVDTTELAIIAETTYDTTNTYAITQQHHATESVTQAAVTDNINNNTDILLTALTMEITTSSVVTAETVGILDQETSSYTLDGLITSAITTESNKPEDKTTLDSVTETMSTVSQSLVSKTNDEDQMTSFTMQSSTITGVTSSDISPLITTQTSEGILSSKDFMTTTSSNNIDTTELTTGNGENTIQQNITTIAETTYVTTNTNAITQQHHGTDSVSQATTTNNVNNNTDNVFTTSTVETTTSSVLTAETVDIVNQDTSRFTLDGLTTLVITAESNTPEENSTLVSVTEPMSTVSQSMVSKTNDEDQTTSFTMQSSTIIGVTSADISPLITTQTTEGIVSIKDFVSVNTSNANNVMIPEVNQTTIVFTESDFITTTEETSNKFSFDAEINDNPTRSTETTDSKYNFTGFTEAVFNGMVPTIFPHPGSEIIDSIKETTETTTQSLDMKSGSTVTDSTQNVSKQNTVIPNISDLTQNSINPIFVTESYKMTDNSFTTNSIDNSLSVIDTFTMSLVSGSESIDPVKETVVGETTTESLDIKTGSTVTDSTQNVSQQKTITLNVIDSMKESTTITFSTESYKMTDNSFDINSNTNSLSVNDTPTTSPVSGSKIINSINDTTVGETTKESLDIKTGSIVTDSTQNVYNQNTKPLNVSYSTTESTNTILVTESYKMTDSSFAINGNTNSHIVNNMPTMSPVSGSEFIDSIKETIVGETTTKSLDFKTGSTFTDTTQNSETYLNVLDSIKDITNPIFVTESSDISKNSLTVSSITNSLSFNDTSTISPFSGSETVNSVKETLVEKTATESLDIEIGSTVTDSTQNGSEHNTTLLNVSDSTKDSVNIHFAKESYKMTDNSLSVNDQDQTSITTVTNIPLEKYQNINTTDFHQDSAMAPTVANFEVTTTAATYISISDINNLDGHYMEKNKDGMGTIETQILNDVHIDITDSNKTTSDQVFSQNNPSTTQFIKNQKNEFGNTLQQIANYDSSGGNLSKTNINKKHDNRNISDQSEKLSSNVIKSTVDSKSINLTETLNAYTMLKNETFGTSIQRKDSLNASSFNIDFAGGSIRNENMIKDDNKIQASTTTDNVESVYDAGKEDVDLKLQSNNSFYSNNEENIANIPKKIVAINENKNFQKEFQNQNKDNINNIPSSDRITDGQNLDYSQNNAPQYVTIVNEQDSLKHKLNTRNVTEGILENSAPKLSLSNQNVGENGKASTTNKTVAAFDESKLTSTSNIVSLNQAMVLDEKLGSTAQTNEIDTINNTNVFTVDLEATSMPNDGFLKHSLVLDQKLSQNAEAKETNTASKSIVPSIETKATLNPKGGSLQHSLTNNEDLVKTTDSNLGRSDIKPKGENNLKKNPHLPSDSSLTEFPKVDVRSKLENDAEERQTVQTTDEVTTVAPTESTVKYTARNSNTNSTNHFDNDKNSLDPFCSTRNRGRYADREDCTKFYICIGKPEPIIGKCPANTVFSEIKKQCTKNKSHCVRGNEFKCLSEGRFSDILKNNAYYICIRRHNHFYRFKFQCQNGYYLNKITVRCTKQVETINQSSTSADVSNSEKSVSEGMSQETKKRKNNTDSKRENKSGEEFECKKEGKFADPNNCRKFYVCTKTKKSEFRMRRKSCDSDELFHKDKKKCVDADSYEC